MWCASDLFAEAIGQVAVAAGRDDTLPMLTGIRVEISGDKVVLAATDRFRLAVRELTWSTDSADVEAAVLVPAKTLAEAAKAGTDGAEVHLSLGAGAAVGKEGLLGIRSNGKRTTTRLLDAEFPKFRQLLPAEHTAVATVGVAELTEAIKRVALVADRVPRSGWSSPRTRCGCPQVARTTWVAPRKICRWSSPASR